MRARPWLASGLALVGLLLAAEPVLGAISGSVTPSAARPGDWVTLMTDAPAGSQTYANLAAGGSLPIYLQSATASYAGNLCTLGVGSLTWRDGVGTLRFQVPAIPADTYWFMAAIQGGCWRFGSAQGILSLAVQPGDPSGLPAAAIPIAALALTGLLVATILVARRRALGT